MGDGGARVDKACRTGGVPAIGRPGDDGAEQRGESMKTDRSLESILREFDIEIIDGAQNRRRKARQTCASQTLENIRRRRGSDHLRSVLMTIVETPNELALVAPVILAVSDVLASLSRLDRGPMVSGDGRDRPGRNVQSGFRQPAHRSATARDRNTAI